MEGLGEVVVGSILDGAELARGHECGPGVAFAAAWQVAAGVARERAGVDVAGVEHEEAHERLQRVGHVIDELDEEPRLAAEAAIRAARHSLCACGVDADDDDERAG